MGTALLLSLLVLFIGCGSEGPTQPAGEDESAVATDTRVEFTEVSREVGLDFVHNSGAFGKKWLPETMGSGCAWVDYDGDGDADALLLSGMDFDGHPTGGRQGVALFRSDGGRFVEVTTEAGLGTPQYAMGVTFGDYDSDLDPDLYITGLGPNRLYRNDDGHFVDVAADVGVDDPGFGSSATWIDLDRDGDLDLFVLNYVEWTPETDIFCTLDGTNKSYCTPEAYPGTSPKLYRNDGAVFIDVTEASGVFDPSGKGLGVVCLDFDGDGWQDILVANDTQPNFLYRNEGNGTFTEQAVLAGVAFDESGRARGAMGADAADYDRSGRPSVVIGNFSNQMLALYHNEGAGFFIDAAPTSALGRQSRLTLAFGTFFFDFDLDGWLDIFVANGHVEDEIQMVQEHVAHAQPPHLFRNLGGGTFEDVARRTEDLQQPMVARGAATADFDGDGDLDVLVMTKDGPARLFRNDGADGRRSIRIALVGGAGSNTDGYGAEVALTTGNVTQVAWSRAGHSYCSQSEKTLTFGIGEAHRADEIVVTWPSGKRSTMENVKAGTTVTVRESAQTP